MSICIMCVYGAKIQSFLLKIKKLCTLLVFSQNGWTNMSSVSNTIIYW